MAGRAMDVDAFERSLATGTPPAGLGTPLVALWHAARGAWDTAHELVQDDPSADAAWVHAWLHRDEGDLPNAGYWYRRAGRAAARGDLRGEWRAIVAALLGGAGG